MTDILMPRLSDSMEEGTILSWLKSDGDSVAQGDELVEIETDKATMTYEAPDEGVLTIVAKAGETIAVGEVIARTGDEAGATTAEVPAEVPAPATEAAPEPAVAAAPPAAVPAASTTSSNGASGPAATPLARRLAAAHGVDLGSLQGSGPRGRILRGDVASAAGIELPAPAAAAAAAPAAPAPSAPAPAASRPAPAASGAPETAKGEVQVVELTRLQQVIARRMAEAKATVPHFQVETEVAMDAAIALRSQFKTTGAEVVPSFNDMVVKAAALALREHPRANGSYKDGHFELYSRVNVGIAVAAADALVVPTINDADRLSLGAIATEARRLAGAVRDGAVTPAELAGATFTVSNLGMFGVTAMVPVINSPQAAILGVGASRAVPALQDGQLVERHLMTLTLSCDHRILYGADAAQLLATIRGLLEDPLRLAL